MSASSINRAANDVQLQARVNALTHKEAQNNPDLGDTVFARNLANGYGTMTPLYWAVAVDTEAAYETALLAQRGAPGFDVDIITDAAISASIVANWPPDPIPPTVPAAVP